MATPTAFEQRYGFRRSEATLANWRLAPYSKWSFQNAGEFVPSAGIACADGKAEPLAVDPTDLLSQPVAIGGRRETVAEFLRRSDTDAFVVMRRGEFVGDYFLRNWALPNVFFHVTTTYNILRHNGVPVGKMDFLGG